MKLTMSQALVKFLDNQYISFDGAETKFVDGIFGIFGHGCVVGIGQALEQGGHNLKFYQGHNEQGMAHAALRTQKTRRTLRNGLQKAWPRREPKQPFSASLP